MQQKPFTHIVVGAGSAGCVVAARIAENERFNVVLLEAGPDCGPDDHNILGVENARRVPMKGQSELYDERIDWNVRVEFPGTSTVLVPQAKLVGGGSSINGGTVLRSTEADSREWAELGNDAWDFESTNVVYQSLEDDPVRGTKGPHPIARTSLGEAGMIQKSFLASATNCGFQHVFDLNETGSEGAGPSPVCRRGNKRISAANTFIDPIRCWRNFSLWPESQVDRVTFSGKRAIGVLLTDGRQLSATHEVIISAGAIFSPALLQRSGIGPADLLRMHKIEMVVNLPVGLNLSDHLCIPIVAKPRKGAYNKDDYSLQMQARWSSSLRPGMINLQMVCFSYLYAQAPDPRVQQRGLAGTASGHVAGIGCNLNKPFSSGTVSIRSVSPEDAPRVVPNYLDTIRDRQTTREVVRKAYKVMTSPAMQAVVEPPIGLNEEVITSDDRLDQYIQGQCSSTYHFCSSCRMAGREKGGVVDQSGRVYGVQGLRVCDASVIPTVPASNTMWTTMMFAERIGSSIRDGKNVSRATGSRA